MAPLILYSSAVWIKVISVNINQPLAHILRKIIPCFVSFVLQIQFGQISLEARAWLYNFKLRLKELCDDGLLASLNQDIHKSTWMKALGKK